MPGRERREVLWLRGDERPRRPRLSRERIVAAAVELLDAVGVEGFSMRRLAARLGAGTMSLYEYVSSREDVLDLALDAALGEAEVTEPDVSEPADASWRAVLADLTTQGREVMRSHPWVPALVGSRPLLGPASLARSERAYAALNRAGLTGPPLIAAVGALFSYVHGYVAAENTWRSHMADPAEEAALRRRAQEHLDRRAELYPTLSGHAQLDYDDFDGGFALGLEIVLDGIEAQLARRGR